MRKNENLTYLHANLFESARKLFKKNDSLSSKESKFLVREVAWKESYRVVLDNVLETKHKEHCGENILQQLAQERDDACVVQTGPNTTIGRTEKYLQQNYISSGLSNRPIMGQIVEKILLIRIGIDGLCTVLRLLNEAFQGRKNKK